MRHMVTCSHKHFLSHTTLPLTNVWPEAYDSVTRRHFVSVQYLSHIVIKDAPFETNYKCCSAGCCMSTPPQLSSMSMCLSMHSLPHSCWLTVCQKVFVERTRFSSFTSVTKWQKGLLYSTFAMCWRCTELDLKKKKNKQRNLSHLSG